MKLLTPSAIVGSISIWGFMSSISSMAAGVAEEECHADVPRREAAPTEVDARGRVHLPEVVAAHLEGVHLILGVTRHVDVVSEALAATPEVFEARREVLFPGVVAATTKVFEAWQEVPFPGVFAVTRFDVLPDAIDVRRMAGDAEVVDRVNRPDASRACQWDWCVRGGGAMDRHRGRRRNRRLDWGFFGEMNSCHETEAFGRGLEGEESFRGEGAFIHSWTRSLGGPFTFASMTCRSHTSAPVVVDSLTCGTQATRAHFSQVGAGFLSRLLAGPTCWRGDCRQFVLC